MSHYGRDVNLYDEKNLGRMVLLQLRIDSISGKQSGDWELPRIAIISSSIRTGRNSHRVALFFRHFLEERKLAVAEILDLQSYNFPLFEERLPYQESPGEAVLDFAGKIKSADGVIIVTPEYNGGYPASLKNAIDLLTEEWRRKPVAISTVSDGAFGGTQVITSLQFSLWKMKAWTVPAMFPVTNANESFDADGFPSDKQSAEKRAAGFIQELLWSIDATNQVPR
jgi:NAD(P)H-dependent FMN reductase